MYRFHYGMIAVALLAGTSLAIAQQEKTQQNSADEALTRSAPEAKDAPQAPPHISASDQASQPGVNSSAPLKDGKLETSGVGQPAAQQAQPGAQQGKGGQDDPAKFSAKNDQIDKTPIMAYPIPLTDEQKRAIFQRLGEPASSAPNITAKLSEQVPATLALQELPADMLASIPSVRDYKFLRTGNRVLIVNPRESIVVGEITN